MVCVDGNSVICLPAAVFLWNNSWRSDSGAKTSKRKSRSYIICTKMLQKNYLFLFYVTLNDYKWYWTNSEEQRMCKFVKLSTSKSNWPFLVIQGHQQWYQLLIVVRSNWIWVGIEYEWALGERYLTESQSQMNIIAAMKQSFANNICKWGLQVYR